MRSSWNSCKLILGKPLTDRAIEKYAEAGWYSAEFRQARREFQARKEARRKKREGNFDLLEDGRMIYRP